MTARRKAKPPPQGPGPQELGSRQVARQPEQWSEIDPAELARRHRQAALLVEHGYGSLPPGWLIGESTAGLFDGP